MGSKDNAHAILWAPYEDVAQVFPRNRRFSGEHKDRGHFSTGETPHYGPQSEYHKNIPVIGNYERRRSFSPEDMPYVKAVREVLNNLAAGNVLRNRDGVKSVEKIPPLEERMIRIAQRQMASRQGVRFGMVIAEASMELLDEFRQAYPNLVPALRYFFEVAGAEGFEVAASDGTKMLHEGMLVARAGRDPSRVIARIGTDNDYFYTRHREDGTPIDQKDKETPAAFEVKCFDKKLGEGIVDRARKAALSLILDDTPILLGKTFREAYLEIESAHERGQGTMLGNPDIPTDTKHGEVLRLVRRKIERLAREVDSEYNPGAAEQLLGRIRRLAGRE